MRRHGLKSSDHLHLIGLVVDDLPDGGERLQRVSVRMDGSRRIEDDPIASGHLAQHVRLTVVRLCESAADTTFDVVAADGVDPVRHTRTLSRRADNPGYPIASLWITSR